MGFERVKYPDGSLFIMKDSIKDKVDIKRRFIDFYSQLYYWKNNSSVEKIILSLLKNKQPFKAEELI